MKEINSAVQACINVFDNSSLEEIINFPNDIKDVWRVGKKLKEYLGCDFDLDNYICINREYRQLEIKSITGASCLDCVLQNYSEGECHHNDMCPGEKKYISFK
jgi:hypothetical protein